MHNLKFYQENIIQNDLINKFNYSNVTNLPKIKKIILNFKTKNVNNIKHFTYSMFGTEFLSTKKCTFTKSKKPNVLLKIQKGQPVGGKVVLKKTLMYEFLSLLIIEILPKMTSFSYLKTNNKNNFSIHLDSNKLTFSKLKEHYNLLNSIPYISVTVVTTSKTSQELFLLLRSFQFNLKHNKKTYP